MLLFPYFFPDGLCETPRYPFTTSDDGRDQPVHPGSWGFISSAQALRVIDAEAKKMLCIAYKHMDVSANCGTPKWMVFNGKPY